MSSPAYRKFGASRSFFARCGIPLFSIRSFKATIGKKVKVHPGLVVVIEVLNDFLSLTPDLRAVRKKGSSGSAHHFRPTYAVANVGHPPDFLVGSGNGGKGRYLRLFCFLRLCSREDVFEGLTLLVIQFGNRQRLSRQHLIAHGGVVDEYRFDHCRLLQVGRG
jgi:hypothetical protein